MANKFNNVDNYIANQSGKGRIFAEQLRKLIKEAIPDCTETIKYNMPAFQLAGKSFLFFAIWKNHAGLYPVYRGNSAFESRVGLYRAKKDAVQFKFSHELPAALVHEIALRQAAERNSVM